MRNSVQLLSITILILCLSACGGGGSAPEQPETPVANEIPLGENFQRNFITQTIDGQLVDRAYLIRYPETLNEEFYPVVFFFHHEDNSAQQWIEQNPEIIALIDSGAFIGIFPEGYENHWNSVDQTEVDDLEFISLIDNDLDAMALMADSQRFAVGESEGAGMVNRLGKQTTLFSAIAPLLGQQTYFVSDTVPLQAVSVFQINASEDPLVPLNGDDRYLSVQQSAENWAANFNCDVDGATRQELWGNYNVDLVVYDSCIERAEIRYAVINGLGHNIDFGGDFDLYSLIWAFFLDRMEPSPSPLDMKLLSLGDSYTIGQSVCSTCNFPEQLKSALLEEYQQEEGVDLQIIARTGWTTTNLKNAIAEENPDTDFDLVTLLIGVNNQYQKRPFSLYETEFVELVNSAISLVDGRPERLIVVSIPDYAYTPFGQSSNPDVISQELQAYNDFAQDYCENNGLSYVYITDITQQGLDNPDLVASDGLHPSQLAYARFVERILPVALDKLP
jgi:poly(3-hydroxybutyrate) depolymerase/lysophospholipase L1-like esterase